MKTITFLLLGTNLGDRKKNLASARNALESSIGRIQKSSSIYQTAAWGKTDQPDFFNQAIAIETELSSQKMLEEILNIELQMGRRREEKWGQRVIDIDILLYGDQVVNTSALTIPHPQLPNRKFALEPLAEIAGKVQHPVLKIEIGEMLVKCGDALPVSRIG
jgi:2-amino-4-hydroxy-6-hydroxymethyldihydropteridine diphosphokinase